MSEQFDFGTALQHMRKKKKIRRASWKDAVAPLVLAVRPGRGSQNQEEKKTFYQLKRNKDGSDTWVPFNFSADMLLAEDWMIEG